MGHMVLPLEGFNVKNIHKIIYKLSERAITHVDKEQDKFFTRLNCQRSEINGLKERLEQSELRARVLELANELMSEWLDNIATKLCFCSCTEGAQV